MQGKSIWFKRLLKVSLIEVDKEGETIDEILTKLKKIRIAGNIPSILSKFNNDGERIWLSNKRLKEFIFLAINLGILVKHSGNYIKSKEGAILSEKRKSTFESLCETALKKSYGISINDIIEAIKNINPPSTARKIARYLNLKMTRGEFNQFEVILQLYGDVNDYFLWTGLITYGIPHEFDLYDKITNDTIKKIIEITGKSKNKNDLRKKIKSIANQDIVKKEEITEISEDVYDKKELNSSIEDLTKIVEDFIEGKKGDNIE